MKTRLMNIKNSFPSCHYAIDYPLNAIPDFIQMYGVNLDPDYQRGYVWTLEQKNKFMGAVLEKTELIPVFWFNFVGGRYSGKSDVIDGKQRLTAILEWLDNKFEAVCSTGDTFYRKDLVGTDETALTTLITLRMKFVNLNRKDAMKFYLTLNDGGTVHSKSELDRVRTLIEKE